jgi:hypothetical protein
MFAHGARLNELVVVIHIVEVDACVPVSARVLIAQLVVEQFLGLGCGIVAVVGDSCCAQVPGGSWLRRRRRNGLPDDS